MASTPLQRWCSRFLIMETKEEHQGLDPPVNAIGFFT